MGEDLQASSQGCSSQRLARQGAWCGLRGQVWASAGQHFGSFQARGMTHVGSSQISAWQQPGLGWSKLHGEGQPHHSRRQADPPTPSMLTGHRPSRRAPDRRRMTPRPPRAPAQTRGPCSTMRFANNTKVLAKRMLKYHRLSWCAAPYVS